MATDYTPLLAYVAEAALTGRPLDETITGLCERMNAAGIPVARAQVAASALHPMLRAVSVRWLDGAMERFEASHDVPEESAWIDSPLHHMILTHTPEMRRRLDRPNTPLDYPVFEEFAAMGLTDWFARAESFEWHTTAVPGGVYGAIATWQTRREGGFTDDDLAAIRIVSVVVSLAVKTQFMDMIARDVLGAYLGADAARRVLSGAITRGGVTQSPAVVMMTDIKGFTHFSNTRPIGDVVALLNDSFQRIADCVAAHNGHILKFVGDGALSIFLLEGREPGDVAADALAAAAAIQAAMPPDTGVDIGLNVGEVHYGNVGSAGRLDFTAIGPAVNEAARLESLCAAVGHRVLMTGAFAALASDLWRARLVELSPQKLRGFDTDRTVFALR